MPAQKYMVVDPRREHSMRIPRPDLSVSLGSPNACTQCHAGRKPDWAAAAMDQWYGKTWRERRHYGTTLHAGATQGAKALPALLALAEDAMAPPIVKATAATLAGPYIRPQSLPVVRKLLANYDPASVAALGLIARVEPAVRATAAARRSVRACAWKPRASCTSATIAAARSAPGATRRRTNTLKRCSWTPTLRRT
jgi:hypothetical protein